MDIGNFPQAGDRLFLMHREVIVTKKIGRASCRERV